MTMTVFKLTVFIAFCVSSSQCRIHELKLEDDERKIIQMSTFGFLKKGFLEVSISFFRYKVPEGVAINKKDMLYGFTLDKSGSSGISAYLENAQGKNCLLKNPDGILSKENNKNNSLSIIFFKIDFDKMVVTIQRNGSDVKNLVIVNNLTEPHSPSKRHVPHSPFSDQFLIGKRHKRDAAASSVKKKATKAPSTTAVLTKAPNTTAAPTKAPSTAAVLTTTTLKTVKTETSKTKKPLEPAKIKAAPVLKEIPMSKFDNNSMEAYTIYFRVNINRKEEEGLYNLYFHNCPSYKAAYSVDMNLKITEKNDATYLSAGEIPLAPLYFSFFVLYLAAGCLWMSVLKKSSDDVYKLHYLMFAVVIVKSFSCMFHAVNIYYIGKEGTHEEAWAVLYYIVYLTKGSLMIITIILVGAGWAFVKHILSDKEKKLFLIIIPLQVFDNIAYIIIEESEEGQLQYHIWKQLFIMIDLLCCGAILFPVVWSIRHLTEASNTDGKAAICLLKLKLFRQFYIMVVCYIYFTRIIVYLISITVPFQYEWLDQLFKELATITFFVVTGYKFRPANDNPYLQVPQDSDEEVEMEEVVTQSGAYDNITRVNQKFEEGGTTPKQRESSHEYD
ncbi:protein GPR107-like [Mytilus edulis]|uniref:protein GPR107-like n=1 Tax=Mytilus edulis TaxID=6550 RepID=UPI0039EEB92D